MCVLTAPSTGGGAGGDGSGGGSLLLEPLVFLLQKFHDVEEEEEEGAFSAGLRYFIALCAMKRALNAVTETTMMAMAASMSYQKLTQAVSTPPLLRRPPATFMMAIIIVQILRQRMVPRASLRRRLIWTFQRRRTGMEITGFGC